MHLHTRAGKNPVPIASRENVAAEWNLSETEFDISLFSGHLLNHMINRMTWNELLFRVTTAVVGNGSEHGELQFKLWWYLGNMRAYTLKLWDPL